jgi:hypothetical protein
MKRNTVAKNQNVQLHQMPADDPFEQAVEPGDEPLHEVLSSLRNPLHVPGREPGADDQAESRHPAHDHRVGDGEAERAGDLDRVSREAVFVPLHDRLRLARRRDSGFGGARGDAALRCRHAQRACPQSPKGGGEQHPPSSIDLCTPVAVDKTQDGCK